MQQEFFTAAMGDNYVAMHAILPHIKSLITLARKLHCKVIHTRESYQPDLSDVSDYRQSLGYVGKSGSLGRFCILGEPGHEFVEQTRPLPGEAVIDKAGFSAFYHSGLDELLCEQGIDHLILCGVTTQACVHSTLRAAVDLGYWCLTMADCCAASEPGMHEAALSLITAEGHLFGWVADLVDIEAAIATVNRDT